MKLLRLMILCLIATAFAAGQNQSQSAGQSAGDANKDTGTSTNVVSSTAESFIGKVDINNASKDSLLKLEGVNGKIADKIIAGRPYGKKKDLVTRKIVDKDTYDMISGKLTVHTPKPKD